MRNRGRIGLIAVAMTVAVAGRGCITTPPPTAESLVAGASSHPAARSSTSLASTDGAETPAPVSPSPPPAPVQTPPAPVAQTAEERRAGLDKQLDDSLGAFDDRLKKEQQKISEERDARQATVAAVTASADGSGGAPDAGAGGAQASGEEPTGARGGRDSKRGGART